MEEGFVKGWSREGVGKERGEYDVIEVWSFEMGQKEMA
jgi:hypothetical protein